MQAFFSAYLDFCAFVVQAAAVVAVWLVGVAIVSRVRGYGRRRRW